MQFVIAGVGLVLAIIIAIWIVIMHSPVPLRIVAGILAEAEEDPVVMHGIKGSASSGYRIEKIESGGNTFEDVRFHSSGIIRMFNKQELIIREIHIGKARITSDFSEKNTSSPESEESTGESAPQAEADDFYFQLDRLTLKDTVIIDRATGFELAIPKLEWTGFKTGRGQFEFGDIRIDSNVLKLATKKKSSSQWDIDATILPGIHERLLKPVSITAVITHEGGRVGNEIHAFDGALHFRSTTDGAETTVIRGLDLAAFIDGPVPSDIQLDMSKSRLDGIASTEVKSGAFRLGVTPFTIEPTQANTTEIVATATRNEMTFRISGPLDDGEDNPLITSTPPMAPPDILAQIYHGMNDAELDAEQRDKLTPALEWFRFAEN
jgi:hypothetical protein